MPLWLKLKLWIPDLIAKLRERSVRENVEAAGRGIPSMAAYGFLAGHPRLWRLAMRLGGLVNWLRPERIPTAMTKAWLNSRTLPRWRGGRFRRWLKSAGRR